MNPISTANEGNLPANIKLANTPDLSEMFARAHGLLRVAPCNMVVNNYFAEAPEHADLRDFLHSASMRRRKGRTMFYTKKSEYNTGDCIKFPFEDPHHFFPGEREEAAPPSFRALFNGLVRAMEPHYPGECLYYDIRIESTPLRGGFHMDGTSFGAMEEDALAACTSRLIIPLTRHGTLVAGHDSARKAPVTRVPGRNPGHLFYDLPRPFRWRPPPGDTWGLLPLAIAFITHTRNPHVPAIHGHAARKIWQVPEKRGLAVLDAFPAKGWK